MSQPTQAILIAAGRGRRLGAHTAEVTKGMVDVGGRTIFGWQWRAMQAAGIERLVVIRGYRADELTAYVTREVGAARVTFVDNHAWQANNVLLSLAQAVEALNQPTLISYSDIIFTPTVAQAAVASPAEVGLVIDRDFRSIYEGRTEHPLDEGEVADLRTDGLVARVGKRALPPADAVGEFIGLVKLSLGGAQALAARLRTLLATHPMAQPYQRAATLQNAYLTDILQDMIDGGYAMAPILIDGQWREIDTSQDLERATALVQSAKEWQ